ncbi:citrate/2-methylcitrate synthase [Kineococcus aurantiacus]|uniref:citrate synthase (unknown stereospecificity) n=1 Tax=Kineococcus aurantiacus TaxID=37633 RepID=A0A7Y9J0C4_9ACTN|nr:citrate synthase [Kineococcus aurantiacus]
MDEIPTAEAAHRLGVKTATLYAYVSRGLLTPRRTAAGSLFDAGQVAALARRGRDRPSGAVETVRSGLTSLDGDRLRYRGRDAVELSRTASFEEVARLLWTGTAVAGALARDEELTAGVAAVVGGLPPRVRPPARLRVAVAVAGALRPASAGADPEPLLAAVLGVTTTVADAVDATLGSPGGWGPALVLLADHGLAVSTVAARVAASARAPLSSVLSAALGAADGPLHASASTAAHRFLEQALADGPARAVAERRRSQERPPGFGHVLYAARDPRAEELLGALPPGPVADVVPPLVEQVVRAHGAAAFPNVDLGLAAHALAHGLAADAGEFVFEVARTAGWVAHALEEYRAPGLRFRVRGLHGQ